MRDSMVTGQTRLTAGMVTGIAQARIDEDGPVGIGQLRLVVGTMAYRHDDVVILPAGVFQAIGPSRPVANKAGHFATTVVHLS